MLVKKKPLPGEKIMIEKPRGHRAVQAVYFIDCSGKQSDLSAATDADGTPPLYGGSRRRCLLFCNKAAV